MKIKYGILNNWIDVTDICFKKLCKNDIITIPSIGKNNIFTDPHNRISKKIFIFIENEIFEYDELDLIQINLKTNKIVVNHELLIKTQDITNLIKSIKQLSKKKNASNSKNLVLITSVINTINKPLSYYSFRSIYTKNERFKQTLKSIESIRKYIPNSYIYLIECSNDIDEEEKIFKELVDTYVNCFNVNKVKNAIQSPHKGIGEMNFLLYFLNNFDNLYEFDHFFKLSGRYYLNNEFDFDKFKNPTNIFKKENHSLVTIFYKITKDFYKSFIEIINNNINNSSSVEGIFNCNIKDYKRINNIGVKGMMFNGMVRKT